MMLYRNANNQNNNPYYKQAYFKYGKYEKYINIGAKNDRYNAGISN